MFKKFAMTIATFFGAGLSPVAPGTMGSFATLPLAFVLSYFGGRDALLLAAVIIFFAGVWAVNESTKDSAEKDPGKIVIDEVVGQLCSFLIVANALEHNLEPKVWLMYALGFGLFRLFDILKFGPVKWADTKLKNAWGVMLDDVFAGFFAAVVLMLLARGL